MGYLLSHMSLRPTVVLCGMPSWSVVGIEVCVAESVMQGAQHERRVNESVDSMDHNHYRCVVGSTVVDHFQ